MPGTRCTRAGMCTAEAAWLALAAAVLLPLRLVVGMLVLLLYYLMGRVCKLFAGRGRPCLVGWRRRAGPAVVLCVVRLRLLSVIVYMVE